MKSTNNMNWTEGFKSCDGYINSLAMLNITLRPLLIYICYLQLDRQLINAFGSKCNQLCTTSIFILNFISKWMYPRYSLVWNNDNDSYHCICDTGYRLEGNGLNCSDIYYIYLLCTVDLEWKLWGQHSHTHTHISFVVYQQFYTFQWVYLCRSPPYVHVIYNYCRY